MVEHTPRLVKVTVHVENKRDGRTYEMTIDVDAAVKEAAIRLASYDFRRDTGSTVVTEARVIRVMEAS
jgi:hypothetical protein